jgi:hypothetical protein
MSRFLFPEHDHQPSFHSSTGIGIGDWQGLTLTAELEI